MQSLRPLMWGLLMGIPLLPVPAPAAEEAAPRAATGQMLSRRFDSLGQPIYRGKPLDKDKEASGEASIKHNLDGLNALRAKAGVPALTLDAKLCDFARKGSLELLKTHVPHGHFKAANVWDSGFENAAAENQGDPHGWIPGAVDRAIDQILQAMMDEGPGGGHHDTIISRKYSRVGIGLVQDKDGRLYLTNDFSG